VLPQDHSFRSEVFGLAMTISVKAMPREVNFPLRLHSWRIRLGNSIVREISLAEKSASSNTFSREHTRMVENVCLLLCREQNL
jgi:hypothetical protein